MNLDLIFLDDFETRHIPTKIFTNKTKQKSLIENVEVFKLLTQNNYLIQFLTLSKTYHFNFIIWRNPLIKWEKIQYGSICTKHWKSKNWRQNQRKSKWTNNLSILIRRHFRDLSRSPEWKKRLRMTTKWSAFRFR